MPFISFKSNKIDPFRTASSATSKGYLETLGKAGRGFRGQPVFRLILAGFLAVALVPFVIVAIQTYSIAWHNTWSTAIERHSALASNLSTVIATYYEKQTQGLIRLASELNSLDSKDLRDTDQLLEREFLALRGLRSLAFAQNNGLAQKTFHRVLGKLHNQSFSGEPSFELAKQSRQLITSHLHRSILDGSPTIVISKPVVHNDDSMKGVIIAELELDTVREMGESIRFGHTGHAVIVDAKGRVFSHPNNDWVDRMKDLSQLSVVKDMMRGASGVTEFDSPSTKIKMITGYTVVPNIGWGIMIPQPKSEVEDQVLALLYPHFLWAGFGILFAMLAALVIARWFTQPINQLAAAANELTEGNFTGKLSEFPKTAPKEIEELGVSFRELVVGLQKSRNEFKNLNLSLEASVQEATKDLRIANQRLEKLAQVDDLTGLFNRRHFEERLSSLTQSTMRSGAQHILLYADLDRFKSINDNYGHHTGDDVLCQFSDLIASKVEPSDVVARIGGDEFTILLTDSSIEDAVELASTIRRDMAGISFDSDGESARLTVSIGLVALTSQMDMPDVMRAADQSCYAAKTQGRDRICVYNAVAEQAQNVISQVKSAPHI